MDKLLAAISDNTDRDAVQGYMEKINASVCAISGFVAESEMKGTDNDAEIATLERDMAYAVSEINSLAVKVGTETPFKGDIENTAEVYAYCNEEVCRIFQNRTR